MKNGIRKWAVLLLCSYVILVSTARIWADGWVYSISQPLPVIRQTNNVVTLRWHRFARWGMKGKCSRELICDVGSMAYPITDPVMEPGWDVFDWNYYLPDDAEGACTIHGIMEYEPLGWIGPKLVYFWKSDKFYIWK